MWTDNEWYGVDLGLVEISSYIQTNVRKASFSLDYFYIGVLYSFVIGREKQIDSFFLFIIKFLIYFLSAACLFQLCISC